MYFKQSTRAMQSPVCYFKGICGNCSDFVEFETHYRCDFNNNLKYDALSGQPFRHLLE